MKNQHLTPLKAIRANCKECVGCDSGYKDVTDCEVGDCTLHPLRFGKRSVSTPVQPSKAIDEYCLHCMGARGSCGRKIAAQRARECGIEECELWHIRFGEKKRGHW